MSLPQFLKRDENEFKEVLRYYELEDDEIESVLQNLEGRKRKEELLKFLKDNRDKSLNLSDILKKKREIFEKYDEMWGYLLEGYWDFPFFEPYYSPEEYVKQEKKIVEIRKCYSYRILSEETIEEIFTIRNKVFKEERKKY